MPDVMSVNDTQLRQILAALNGDWWWHWFQVVSIFASAFFGYVSGIALEHFKTRQTGKKATRERQEKEVAQVNVAISGISYNIEILLHVVCDHILPHHKESHIAYTALQKVQGNCQKQEQLAMSLPALPALTTTCPEVHFLEWDFFKELPFIVKKDPELLKNTGWLISQSRELTAAIKKPQQHYCWGDVLHRSTRRTENRRAIQHTPFSKKHSRCRMFNLITVV